MDQDLSMWRESFALVWHARGRCPLSLSHIIQSVLDFSWIAWRVQAWQGGLLCVRSVGLVDLPWGLGSAQASVKLGKIILSQSHTTQSLTASESAQTFTPWAQAADFFTGSELRTVWDRKSAGWGYCILSGWCSQEGIASFKKDGVCDVGWDSTQGSLQLFLQLSPLNHKTQSFLTPF